MQSVTDRQTEGEMTVLHTYINEFITRNTVKQSSNQRRGQSLGGGGAYETRELK